MIEQETVPQTTLAVTSVSRPKRVAFLAHPEETGESQLNSIISYCITVWGGRFHAIIPTDGTDISKDWWRLLVALDPDIIYSLVPLHEQLIKRINRHILPSKIIEPTLPKVPSLDSNYIDSSDIGALGIEDIPRFMWSKRGSFREPAFFLLKSSRDKLDGFLLRNFGILPDILSINSAFRDIPHEAIEAESLTPKAFFDKVMPSGGRTVVPIDFCQFDASRNYRLDFDPFTNGFHVVVGDSPYDIIYAWNRALTASSGLGRNFIWLSTSLCEDDNILRLVGQWIQRTYWQEPKIGKVVSYSVDEGRLKSIAEKIGYLFFTAVNLTQDQFPFPAYYPGAFYGGILSEKQEVHTDQISLSENKGLIRFIPPVFLTEEHPQAGWMVDLDIQYHPERYSYTNVRPSWQLPKSLGIANQFFSSSHECRIIIGGFPSAAVTTSEKTISISIPSDFSLIWTYFSRYYSNVRRSYPLPSPRFKVIKISDKGRYLQGMIQLFGNTHYAGYTFEDPFWRDIFLLMSGRPDPKVDLERRTNLSLRALNEIFAEDPTPIGVDSPKLQTLAEKLARALTLRDKETTVLTLKDIKVRFKELREQSLKTGINRDWWAEEKFDEYKEVDLANHLEAKVLLQGAELSCPYCKTRQFYVVDDLASEIRCNGCMSRFFLKPSPEWSFKLNDLVSNALRRHGTLAVLQALYTLQQDSRSGMFLYLPCLDVYENDRNPFTDIDIVVMSNGRFSIGEVKSVPSGFKAQDFAKLNVIAEEILPDEVIIASPGDKWPDDVKSEIAKLTESLKVHDIRVVPRLLEWYP